jgi:Carboxypeptidase regulatory-like domain/TonB-dependent Receptor Plug Domain/TonB dependent receptor
MAHSEFTRTCARSAVYLALLLSFCLPAKVSAQVVGATISGTVTDTSGSKMPGVDIVITNVGTGIATTTVTKGEGTFGAPNLQPGNYEISATAKGFSTLVRKGITLTVGQELILNLSLQVGSVNEQVTVTAEAPTVNLANATISGVIEQRTVQELPLNGRSWTDLATLQPGVHASQNQPPINAGDRVKRGLGLELTISGARPQQNNYLLDGVNINDYANAGPGSVLGGNLGTDAVAEFSVLTTNYSTEYGRTSGGIITATTKSGTNQFHGSAYEFFRNDALDAASFIDNANGVPKGPLHRNQYGGSAGGPIQKDKTFIFGDYEGVKQSLGTTSVSNVPSTDALGGLLTGSFQGTTTDPFPTNCIATGVPTQCQLTPAAFDTNIKQFLSSGLIPKGNLNDVIGGGSNTAQFAFTAMQHTTENFFIIRADHTFSTKDRIFSTYLFDKASQSEPDEYKTKLLNNPMFRQMVAIEENHVFSPSLLNSFRVGFNRDNVESPSGATAILPAAADTALGFIPGTTVGNLVIGSDNLTGYSGGLDVAAPFKFHWNSYQVYDNLFYTKGRHSMKFGGNVERLQGNTFGADFPGGQLIFNSLYDFLTNRSGAVNADVPGTVTGRGVRQTIFGAYFQDDIHLRPNLTLNWGLRYEMASIITEANGKLSNLRVFNSAPPVPFLGSPYIMNPTKKNFEPRVGFAWDPFKDGKTSVAGGFGMFDVLPFPVEMGSGVDGSAPFDVSASQSGLSTPYVTNTNCSAPPCGGYGQALANQSARYYVMQFNPKRNYVMQWNFNIQRQITPNTTMMVGYVGARGIHMRFQADDNNMVLPTTNAQGQLQWPCALPLQTVTAPQGYSIQACPITTAPDGTTGVPALPAYWFPHEVPALPPPIVNQQTGRTQMALWDGQYFYDGLQVQVNKAMSRTFEVGGSYTYSKNIDTGGGSVASDPFRNSISTLLWFCKACRRGLSDQDQRHNLTVHYEWDIPTPGSLATPLKALVGNWEAGGILTIASGTPFTVLVAGDPLGMGTTDPYQYPDKVPGAACANPVNPQNASNYIKLECFQAPSISTRLGDAGRNSAIGPGLIDMDFSLFKNIPIHEALKAQFRAEFFNILNRPNFNSPNDNRAVLNFDGTTNGSAPGAITLMNTTSRQIQFALKFTW